MNSDPPNAGSEQTFVVFAADYTTLAIPAAAVLQIRVPTESTAPPGAGTAATRVLVLRSGDENETLLLPVGGALQLLTIPSAQVAPLPRLCRAANGVAVAVAMEEDRILFLIVDPIVFLRTQGSPAIPMSTMEPL